MRIFNISKRQVILILFVIMLVVTYILLQSFETKVTVAETVEFNNMLKECKFVLGGEVKGIKLLATGVLVIGKEIDNNDIYVGDVILKVNDKIVESNKELVEHINEDKNIKVHLTIQREGKEKNIEANKIYNPAKQKYELGCWVKDSSAGVGTMTFYEVNNKLFAGLGHGITETENNVIIPITSGAIIKSDVKGINKGKTNAPGDIRGVLYKDVIGQITKNTQNGIYGYLETDELITNKEEISLASKGEIKEGEADVYCALDGINVEKYKINIEKILYESKGNKNMVVCVTDKKLLDKTGGIIQGMSGSPIVQNGKLIGAITHVFLNDSKRGYAVFIQNMVDDLKKIK